MFHFFVQKQKHLYTEDEVEEEEFSDQQVKDHVP